MGVDGGDVRVTLFTILSIVRHLPIYIIIVFIFFNRTIIDSEGHRLIDGHIQLNLIRLLDHPPAGLMSLNSTGVRHLHSIKSIDRHSLIGL